MPYSTAARDGRHALCAPPVDAPARVTPADIDSLYREHASRLWMTVRGLVFGTDDQVDDACARAWLILLRVRPCCRSAFAWLVTVAVREVWRLVREDDKHAPLVLRPDAEFDMGGCVEPGDVLGPMHARDRLRAVARTLPERKRKLVALQALGFTYAEIAEITGTTYTAVNRHLSEAYRLLDPLREPLGA